MNYNKIIIAGNLTRNPEVRRTPNGRVVCNMTIAYNERFGDDKKHSYFFSVIVWGKTGENCAKYLKKGSSVLVEGKLTSRSYEGKDGIKRNVTEIQALNVVFCGGYDEPKEPENIEQNEEIYNGEVPF